jgi:hypothetical protein
MVRIGPIVVEAFPDACGTLCHIGFPAAEMMHLEVRVGAVAKKLRAARSEVGESGYVLLGRQSGCLTEVKLCFRHFLLLLSNTALSQVQLRVHE